jgi:uncharacterized membrane protein YhaH (DUF805 family)
MNEIDQNKMDSGSVRVKWYIIAILILCFLAVTVVLGLTFIRPEQDNLAVIAIVLGIFTPIVTALLAAALKENHDAMNSRLTQLLTLTEVSAKAVGKLEGAS